MIRKVHLVLLGAAIGASGVALTRHDVFSAATARAAASDTYRNLNLFGDVFDKVRSDYVEKPDDQKLVESAINGMLTSLDPHSSYMDAKSFRDMQVQTRGEFGGLGIEVTQEDGMVKVVTPIDDTPAAKAGILTNDLISAIDGDNVQGLTLNQAVDKMRGPVNTPVVLTILRGEKKDKQDIKLVRAIIQIKSVRARQEGDDIGYIRITQFNEQTFDGLKAAMQKFQTDIPNDKFKGYIIDLRNNPGGLLDQSIAVSNAFIDRGEIVSTRGAQRRRDAALQRAGRRPLEGQAGGRADQRRFCLGVGDRCGCSPGPQARNHSRYALLRQRLGPDDHPARPEQRRAAADHGAVLHAVGPIHPGQGYRAGRDGDRRRAGRIQGQG